MNRMLSVQAKLIEGWEMPVLDVQGASASIGHLIRGSIGNSITTSKGGARKTAEWKRVVCSEVFGRRGHFLWDPGCFYALTLGFRFYTPLHGGGTLDVENFIKPTVDAIAAGLFLPADEDPCAVSRYCYDDTGFRHLLVHRLEDAGAAQEEGLALYVVCWVTRGSTTPRENEAGYH